MSNSLTVTTERPPLPPRPPELEDEEGWAVLCEWSDELQAWVWLRKPCIDIPLWAKPMGNTHLPDGQRIRYRVARGGRGSAKSRTFARWIIMRARAKTERILCAREYQNSIRDSSKRLIEDEMVRLGYRHEFRVTDKEIIHLKTGSRFIFLGMHGKDQSIRSLEGVTIVWLEEAASVSQASLDALDPTIRSDDAEIWVSYNPRFETDPIDRMFVSGKGGPPPGTQLLIANWQDNPWFPAALRKIKDHAQLTDPDKYAHIWLGQYLQNSNAKVFKNWSISDFETPEAATRRFGADWGFAQDPTVLVSCFIGRWAETLSGRVAVEDPKGNVLFVDHEAYGIGVEIDDTPALFAGDDVGQPKPRWKNRLGVKGVPGAHRWMITADSARPEMISYMRARGFAMRPSIKGPNSIEEGVRWLQNYEIVIHPRCQNVVDEVTLYQYKIDKLTGDILPILEDKNNNTIDALRYALETLRKASGTFTSASSGTRVGHMQEQAAREVVDQITGKAEKPVLRGWGSAPAVRKGFD